MNLQNRQPNAEFDGVSLNLIRAEFFQIQSFLEIVVDVDAVVVDDDVAVAVAVVAVVVVIVVVEYVVVEQEAGLEL